MISPVLPERHLESQNGVRIIMILAGIILACASYSGCSPRDNISGLRPGRLLTIEVALPEHKYGDADRRIGFFQQALERVSALPGVESAGAVSTHPLSDKKQSVRFTIEPTTGEAVDSISAGFNVVSPGYFQTLATPLLMGRSFTETDRADTARVVVINETLARRFFPTMDALGKRVQFDDLEEQSSWVVIVGVVGDTKRADSVDTEPEFYMSYLQASLPTMTIVVRAAGDARELAASVEREIKAVDADIAVSNIATMK